MEEIYSAIFKTVCYADIFDYPLKLGEIEKYFIADKFHLGGVPPNRRAHHPRCFQVLTELVRDGKIEAKGEYYFLSGREKIVELRKRREKWSREKTEKARKAANRLKLIPTVKLVGISGALAMENSDEDDDIDLFIITSAGRLWLTRFLVTLLVELTGRRRRPSAAVRSPRRSHGFRFAPACHHPRWSSEVSFRDKICLNMFLDEDHLAVPEKERNLFTAHEVIQMRPVWEREGIYQRFLAENEWVNDYLPNALRNKQMNTNKQISRACFLASSKINKSISNSLCCFAGGLEKLLMNLQLKHMEKRRTIEKISPGRILFHPEDKGEWVMEKFEDGWNRIKSGCNQI